MTKHASNQVTSVLNEDTKKIYTLHFDLRVIFCNLCHYSAFLLTYILLKKRYRIGDLLGSILSCFMY